MAFSSTNIHLDVRDKQASKFSILHSKQHIVHVHYMHVHSNLGGLGLTK